MTIMTNVKLGRLFLVEGANGTGKTTLARALVDAIPGSVLLHEPGTSQIGKSIRDVLSIHKPDPLVTLFLYSAARAELVNKYIKPILDSGRDVILDRFTLSTEVYQCDVGGLDENIVQETNSMATGGMDWVLDAVTILMVAPTDIAVKRAHIGNWSSLDIDFQERVQRAYLSRVNQWPNILILDGTANPEDLVKSALTFINDDDTDNYSEVRKLVGSQGVLEITK